MSYKAEKIKVFITGTLTTLSDDLSSARKVKYRQLALVDRLLSYIMKHVATNETHCTVKNI